MAGPIAQRQLSPRAHIEFREARESDDARIRKLLRETPTGGLVSTSFEREPNYFRAASLGGGESFNLVCYRDERLVGLGSASVQTRFVNGAPHRVAYLKELRLAEEVQGRFDILRRGYQAMRLELEKLAPDLIFTSIAVGNGRALRALERGFPGMPTYERLASLATILIPVRRSTAPNAQRLGWKLPTALSEVVDALNSSGESRQLARFWDAQTLNDLAAHGLDSNDLWVNAESCVGVWDQRAFKQTVVRDYSDWLKRTRWAVNLLAQLRGQPKLPEIGATISHGFAFPLGVDEGNVDEALKWSARVAALKELDWITVGLDSRDARLKRLRKIPGAQEYLTHLYLVQWPGLQSTVTPQLDMLFEPEISLM